MLATSISLVRPVICSWWLSEYGRCGPIPKELSLRRCQSGDEWMVLECTARTWASAHSSIHACGFAKDAVAGGEDEWLTAGDVTTYHEWCGIAGGRWQCVLFMLYCWQHVIYYIQWKWQMQCMIVSFAVRVSKSHLSKLPTHKCIIQWQKFSDYWFLTFLTGSWL